MLRRISVTIIAVNSQSLERPDMSVELRHRPYFGPSVLNIIARLDTRRLPRLRSCDVFELRYDPTEPVAPLHGLRQV